ncbi:hypothetical protein CTEN210_11256 [Chaetoceros tenuissimus]|uniref:peptidylprolyl isomerase n=1 Tax=Chaetoceros tenuissimus TaxID=426638 RepID=A0AAD3D179_9STRA|nr:hypothetical protein CTEN210_11256 [Chaetoceros tenuissimus]
MFSKKFTLAVLLCAIGANAFSVDNSNRRAFLAKFASGSAAVVGASALAPTQTLAAPEIIKLNSGVKYAVTKPVDKGSYPQVGDFVVVEYTGYLANGQIFDATHSEGKKNALLFKLGSNAVIPGLNEVVANMKVGEKVQAIMPPNMAFGDDGICIEKGDEKECLIKPGATLVYDVLLKKTSIPPP